jgi:hypothetical protein
MSRSPLKVKADMLVIKFLTRHMTRHIRTTTRVQPKDGLSPEEFRRVMEFQVQAFLFTGDPILTRAWFTDFSANSGWPMGSVCEYLNQHSELREVAGGWAPATPEVDMDVAS